MRRGKVAAFMKRFRLLVVAVVAVFVVVVVVVEEWTSLGKVPSSAETGRVEKMAFFFSLLLLLLRVVVETKKKIGRFLLSTSRVTRRRRATRRADVLERGVVWLSASRRQERRLPADRLPAIPAIPAALPVRYSRPWTGRRIKRRPVDQRRHYVPRSPVGVQTAVLPRFSFRTVDRNFRGKTKKKQTKSTTIRIITFVGDSSDKEAAFFFVLFCF